MISVVTSRPLRVTLRDHPGRVGGASAGCREREGVMEVLMQLASSLSQHPAGRDSSLWLQGSLSVHPCVGVHVCALSM